jgi:hypothetical protein
LLLVDHHHQVYKQDEIVEVEQQVVLVALVEQDWKLQMEFDDEYDVIRLLDAE